MHDDLYVEENFYTYNSILPLLLSETLWKLAVVSLQGLLQATYLAPCCLLAQLLSLMNCGKLKSSSFSSLLMLQQQQRYEMHHSEEAEISFP